jgi:hypothetical protein
MQSAAAMPSKDDIPSETASNVPAPVYQVNWSPGLVMNSASGTWPNNLFGLAKLIFDTVQLLSFPFMMLNNSACDMSKEYQTLETFCAIFHEKGTLQEYMKWINDPLSVIQALAQSLAASLQMHSLALDVGGYWSSVSPEPDDQRGDSRFIAASTVVVLQFLFLFLNTRSAMLWKLRQHVIQPGVGAKFFVTRYLPRWFCSALLLTVMWLSSTVLFMPVTEALIEEVMSLYSLGSIGRAGCLFILICIMYLCPVSRLQCLQDRIEYMDVSVLFWGRDSLEDAMQDSHLFSIRSIFYQRIFFILQTAYILIGVICDKFFWGGRRGSLIVLLILSATMLVLPCLSPPYYHQSVNSFFVIVLGYVLWANVTCLVYQWRPEWLRDQSMPASLLISGVFMLCSYCAFKIARILLANISFRKILHLESHKDTTYLPLLSVFRVPNLEAIAAAVQPVMDQARDQPERVKLVAQGAIPAVTAAYKYLLRLRQASATLVATSRTAHTWGGTLKRFSISFEIYITLGLQLRQVELVNETTRNTVRALGNLMVGANTSDVQQAGVPTLLLGEIWAASQEVELHYLKEAGGCALLDARPSEMHRVPFDKLITQFAMTTVMNTASTDAIKCHLMEVRIVPVLLPLLRFAALKAEQYLSA